jgi:hypothetical protein
MDVRTHLADRGVQFQRYNSIHYDDVAACFYLYNLSGQIVGFQRYTPFAPKARKNVDGESRYFTYCKGKLGAFGLETFYYRNDILFVTEGLFDACRIHNCNLPALALLQNDPKPFRSWLHTLNRTIIGICDDDEAGFKLKKHCHLSLTVTGAHDMGDMTDEQARSFLSDYIK